MKLINLVNIVPFSALSTDKELCLDVQTCLAALGRLEKVDGVYGPKTENALVQFKRNNKLTGGNAIGPTTAKVLLAAKPSELVTRKQAEYVYQTKLTDAQFVDLNRCLRTFSITSKEDIRIFLSQTGHESGGLLWLEEIWGPTEDQLSYEGRSDLGNVEVDDGYKYRGASAIMTTGRGNYQALSNYLKDSRVMEGASYVAFVYPLTGAGFFWKQNDISKKIAAGADIYQISALVNTGSMRTDPYRVNGMADRLKYFKRALKVI